MALSSFRARTGPVGSSRVGRHGPSQNTIRARTRIMPNGAACAVVVGAPALFPPDAPSPPSPPNVARGGQARQPEAAGFAKIIQGFAALTKPPSALVAARVAGAGKAREQATTAASAGPPWAHWGGHRRGQPGPSTVNPAGSCAPADAFFPQSLQAGRPAAPRNQGGGASAALLHAHAQRLHRRPAPVHRISGQHGPAAGRRPGWPVQGPASGRDHRW